MSPPPPHYQKQASATQEEPSDIDTFFVCTLLKGVFNDPEALRMKIGLGSSRRRVSTTAENQRRWSEAECFAGTFLEWVRFADAFARYDSGGASGSGGSRARDSEGGEDGDDTGREDGGDDTTAAMVVMKKKNERSMRAKESNGTSLDMVMDVCYVKSLLMPLPHATIAERTTDEEMDEAKDLLQQHVKHAKKVRARWRNPYLFSRNATRVLCNPTSAFRSVDASSDQARHKKLMWDELLPRSEADKIRMMRKQLKAIRRSHGKGIELLILKQLVEKPNFLELAIDDPAAVVTVKPATKQTVKNIANDTSFIRYRVKLLGHTLPSYITGCYFIQTVVAKELEAKKVSLLDFEN
ncbi:hypothetical protein Tco_0270898 [Tanacetum coccineum]